MTKPRLTPPTIQIGTQRRRMTGNARDGYRLRIDEEFRATVTYYGDAKRTWFTVQCLSGTKWRTVHFGALIGCHEQAAANAAGRWFADRARKWGSK